MAPPDPLDELRERVRATQDAAERLAGEARATPPTPRDETARRARGPGRAAAHAARPRPARAPAAGLRRDPRSVLLLLRAMIDYWVERLDAAAPAEVEVQDIPVE